MSDRIRVFRILVYEGEREVVEDTLQKNRIKGTSILPKGKMSIRSAIIGEYPEIMEEIPNEDTQS